MGKFIFDLRVKIFVRYFCGNPEICSLVHYVHVFPRYIVNLLNKFEVALTWDSRTLLIPSLLPVEETECSTVKIATKMTSWSVPQPKSSFEKEPSISSEIKVHPIPQPNKSISRLLLMSYFPSGFWSRLLTRILADLQIVNVLKDIYPMQVFSFSNTKSSRFWKLNYIIPERLH